MREITGKQRLIIGVVVLAMVAAVLVVPSIFAQLSGQHVFIDPSEVKCEACHLGISDQLNASSVHAGTLNDGTAWALDCKACHDVGLVPAQGAHAASTIPCSECHENQDKTFWHDIMIEGEVAKTFLKKASERFDPPYDCGIECHSTNKTALIGNTPEGELALGSHEEFYRAAINSTLMLHADESCISCHTLVAKTITIPEAGKAITYNASTNEFGIAPV